MKIKNQRTTKLIDKPFQIKLITRMIIINALVLIIFGGILYLFLNSEVESNLMSAHVTYNNVSKMLFPIILTLSLINILLIAIASTIVVIYASHRIAGPIFRVKAALTAIENRNLNPITKFREKDQLFELSHSLTKMTNLLSQDLQGIKQRAAECLGNPEKLSPELRVKIEEIASMVDKYKF